MKRFFQPVPKDGSPAKKRPTGAAAASDCVDGPAATAASAGGGEGAPCEEPRRFVTWNANSLLLRMKSDWSAFSQFVARLDPDVICIQVNFLRHRGFRSAPFLLCVRICLLPRVLTFNCTSMYCSEGFLCGYAAMWHARAAAARRHFIEHIGGVSYYLSFYAKTR
jgi:hypothetical protein